MNKTLEQIVAELKLRHKKVILHLKDGPKAIIGNLEYISTNQTRRDLQKYRIVVRTVYANKFYIVYISKTSKFTVIAPVALPAS